jgi:hypothetical protein
MGLSEIAAGLEVTTEQREQGVATVDRTDATLAERLTPIAAELPCAAAEAATLLDAYAEGKCVGAAGAAAGLAPITAAKTLHRFGESVTPVTPLAMDVVDDWLAGDLSRSEAMELTGAGDAEFALATYVATHDPLPEAREAAAAALDDAGAQADDLTDTMSDVDELL